MTPKRNIAIYDKWTNQPIITVRIPTQAKASKASSVCFSMLTCLYSLDRKGKAQFWRMPKELAPALKEAYGWDSNPFERATLYNIELRWY